MSATKSVTKPATTKSTESYAKQPFAIGIFADLCAFAETETDPETGAKSTLVLSVPTKEQWLAHARANIDSWDPSGSKNKRDPFPNDDAEGYFQWSAKKLAAKGYYTATNGQPDTVDAYDKASGQTVTRRCVKVIVPVKSRTVRASSDPVTLVGKFRK
jgi:hypothetical protein